MPNRCLLVVVSGFAVSVLVAGICMTRPGRVGPTWTNYSQIQDGTTIEEAESRLGKATSVSQGGSGSARTVATWVAEDDSVFWIAFRADGTVMKQWFDSKRVTIFDKILRRLHLA
ncbi:MAG: hypothetical protein JWO38_4953 [Gemmataceae bacterium]|nr:hypothetical protein [Gemmataceae bacterium]